MDVIPTENTESVQSSSLDNPDREEMLWDSRIETLLKGWGDECKEKSESHNKAAKKKKCLHRSLAIPSIVVPLFMAAINQMYSEDVELSVWINSIGYFLTGSLTGVNTFINYASQYEQHYIADARYYELYTEIESVLVKKKKNRVQADVVLEQIKNKYEHLNKTSPDI
jgi:hypothetical protein